MNVIEDQGLNDGDGKPKTNPFGSLEECARFWEGDLKKNLMPMVQRFISQLHALASPPSALELMELTFPLTKFSFPNALSEWGRQPSGSLERKLHSYLCHDVQHLNAEHQFWRWVLHVAGCVEQSPDNSLDASQWTRLKQRIVEMTNHIPELLPLMSFPYRMIQIELSDNPSKIPDLEFDITHLLKKIAVILQWRYPLSAYHIHSASDHESSNSSSNRIILDLESITVKKNPSIIFTILYNILKNSARAHQYRNLSTDPSNEIWTHTPLYREIFGEGAYSENPQEIIVRSRTISKYAIVWIEDNAGGFQLDNILTSLRRSLQNGSIQVNALPGIIQTIVERWQKDPLAFREISTGQIIDLTTLNNVSGFSVAVQQPTTEQPSGIGLHALDIARRLGITVKSTNTIEGGAGTLICVPIDQQCSTNWSPGFRKQLKSIMRPAA